MKLEVDNVKTYTYGDWVEGAILLGPEDGCSGEIIVELGGTITLSYHGRRTDTIRSESFYVMRKTVRFSGDEKPVHFALQFPDRKEGGKILSTVRSSFPEQVLEIKHTLTVEAVKQKLFSSRSTKTLVVLQFRTSESFSLLSAPRKVIDRHCHDGLAAIADLDVPSFFTQGGVGHKISIKLSKPEVTGLRLLSAQAKINWYCLENSVPGNYILVSTLVASSKYKSDSKEATNAVFVIKLSDCVNPTYLSTNFVCRYILDVQVKLFNHRTQRCQSVSFRDLVKILPRLLYVDKTSCFATQEEIRDMIKREEDRRGLTVTSCN